MKLIKLNCPNCNSVLEVNEEMKQFTCNYCGTTTLLDDEIIKVKHISSNLTNLLADIEDYYDNGNYLKCYEMANELIKEYPKNKKLLSYLCDKKILKALDEKKIIDEISEIKEQFDSAGFFSPLYNYSFTAKKIINEYRKKYPNLDILDETEKSINKYLKHQDLIARIFLVIFALFLIWFFVQLYLLKKQYT